MISAKIIADSISESGKRLTTMQLTYPRFIHAEFMTHRVFSRNASSSRAIPVRKMIEMVRNEPAMPIHWGLNQPGMQAERELSDRDQDSAHMLWLDAANAAADIAEKMMALGLHKQVANRILEPFQHIHVVVTATEFSNFFALRAHPDAQPEIHELALQMLDALAGSEPTLLSPGEWHLPYVTAEDMTLFGPVQTYLRGTSGHEAWNDEMKWSLLRKISAARCCRVSYLKHDGTAASIADDLELCDKLAGAVPIHASPFEHQATPDLYSKEAKFGGSDSWGAPYLHGNFVGWIQFRKIIESKFSRSSI